MEREITVNEKLVRNPFDAFNQQNWEKYAELLAEDVVLHESGRDMHGVEAVVEYDKQIHEEHSNVTITVADSVASGDRVAAREEFSAESVETRAILFGRVEDGQLAELWVSTG